MTDLPHPTRQPAEGQHVFDQTNGVLGAPAEEPLERLSNEERARRRRESSEQATAIVWGGRG